MKPWPVALRAWSQAACTAAVLASAAFAQDAPAPPATTPEAEEATKNASAACLEPPPMIRIQDYNGPFQKVVATFARKLDRKSVHAPHFRPDAMLCSLEPKDKLQLFLADTFEPASLLGVAFNSGLDQAQNSEPTSGQGTAGYAKRLGANFASQTSSRFFSSFVYPTIFREDPRYYRLAHGKLSARFFHALEHTVVAHGDSGRYMFNFSEWLGTATGAAVGEAYHPGSRRGFGAAASGASISILNDMGFDVLREFWPEIARKFHLPFRGTGELDAPAAN